jgi:hypothetical protein
LNAGNLTVDAANKTNDPGQRWQIGQPSAANEIDGTAVIFSNSGWDDVPNNTVVNTLICATPNRYESSPSGKWYRPHYYNQTGINFANTTCRNEGGSLVKPFGTWGANVTSTYYPRFTATSSWFYADGVKIGTSNWSMADGKKILQKFIGIKPFGELAPPVILH